MAATDYHQASMCTAACPAAVVECTSVHATENAAPNCTAGATLSTKTAGEARQPCRSDIAEVMKQSTHIPTSDPLLQIGLPMSWQVRNALPIIRQQNPSLFQRCLTSAVLCRLT